MSVAAHVVCWHDVAVHAVLFTLGWHRCEASVTSAAPSKESPLMTTSRIAIIGAGFAGLSAAVQLSRAGHAVQLFEARDRVGGRVWSEALDIDAQPVVIERGAEFILDGYDVLREYCAGYGLKLADTGMSYYVREAPELPDVTTQTLAAFGARAVKAAENSSQPTSVTALLDELDDDPSNRAALQARIETSAAVSADLLDSSGVFFNASSSEPAASWRIAGGNQRLADALAAEIADRLTLACPITAVTATDEGLTVTTDHGSYPYDYVVVAIPFMLLQQHAIDIDLPAWKQSALSHLVQGNAAKLHLPLRRATSTSAVMSVRDRFWTWTANDGDGHVAPVLNCFGGHLDYLNRLQIGHGSDTWAQIARRLRPDLDFQATEATLTAWHLDPWARGAYANHAPGFSIADAEALKHPVGNIYFAGEYTEPDTGLMESALRSGHHAASQIHHAATASD